MLKLTTDKHEASRGLSATSELLVSILSGLDLSCQQPRLRNGVTYAMGREVCGSNPTRVFFYFIIIFLLFIFHCSMRLVKFNVYFNRYLQNSLYMRL